LGTVYYRNKEGQFHRLNGPAIEGSDGYKAYYFNGKKHRLDGPAKIWPSGYKEYWVNDRQLTKKEFDKLTKHND